MPRCPRVHAAVLIAAALASSPPALGADLVPLGPPFALTADTSNTQKQPWVAADDRGNFVVSWSKGDAFARRFDRDGNPLGGDLLLNPTLSFGEQDETYVSLDPITGDFVVVWSDRHGNDGFQMGCGGRFLAADGTPYGPEQILNVHTDFSQFEPYVALASTGRALAVWTDAGLDGSAGVIGRLFDRFGNPVSGEILINEPNSATQIDPSVAADRQGNFVVAWVDASGQTGEPREIMARRFDGFGNPLGPQFLVNSVSAGMQREPLVAVAAQGDFVVVWQDESGGDGDGFGVFGRCFAADGSPRGPQFGLSETTSGDQRDPHVAVDYVGNFLCTWEDDSGGDFDVVLRRFDRFGNPLSGEIPAHPPFPGDQTYAKAAMSQNGQRAVVVWFDGPNQDAIGRVFALDTLAADTPLSPGQTSTISIELPGMGGETYALLPSLSTTPPIPVAGGRFLDLAPDLLMQIAIAAPIGSPFQNLISTLDAQGRADASISIPNDPAASGLTIHFAAVTLQSFAAEGVGFVTDPLSLPIQ